MSWNSKDPWFWGKMTLKEVKEYINNGGKIDIRDSLGCTPLHKVACYVSNSRKIIALLNAGADVNARGGGFYYRRAKLYQASPLHFAATYNTNPKVIKALLDAGADVNAFDKEGFTPLMRATTKRNNKAYNKPEIISVLLNASADVNAWNTCGNTALHLGVLHTYRTEVINLLLDAGADVNAWNKDKNTPLHFAIEDGANLEIINALIQAGADVNMQNNHGETPLNLAVGKIRNRASFFNSPIEKDVNLEIVNTLIQAGADVNISNDVADTPLHKAVKENTNNEIIKALLNAGADVNAMNFQDGTPLHCAITTPSHANKNRSSNSYSTYHNSDDFCEGCEVDVVKILLAAGANVGLVSGLLQSLIYMPGDTPLSLAKKKIINKSPSSGVNQVLEVIELLKDAAAKLLINPALLKKVSEFELSVRTIRCLKDKNIISIGDLVQKTEADLISIPNFGDNCLYEIKETLAGLSLHLGMDVMDSTRIYKN